jgi:hypothetical protein
LSALLLLFRIQKIAERREFSLPEAFVVPHPIMDLAERPGVQAVVALAASAADLHEPRPEKNAEVLGDGRACHGEGRGDPANWQFASAKKIEKASARWIANGGEHVTRGRKWCAFHVS